MAYLITGWNITPNRVWYVRLAPTESAAIDVELYLTQANAEARTSLQASGTSDVSGQVTLTNDPDATEPVSLYQSSYLWHLLVSGSSVAATIFRVKEFVELDEIGDPLFMNSDLIPIRANAEIDLHTHAVIRKEIELGSHLTTLEPGDVVALSSTRADRSENLQVLEHNISGEISEGGEMKLTSTIVAAAYMALKR